MKNEKPILTIAIPTFNRSYFLNKNLNQLRSELKACRKYNIEILILNNASTDNTEKILLSHKKFINFKYINNLENIGAEKNIIKSFNEAAGTYVLILGDDDLFVDGALLKLLRILSEKKNGVVCMRPYGFEKDFRREFPAKLGKNFVFNELNLFLLKINSLMTLISSCVINKSLIPDINPNNFCGTDLVQVSLLIEAAKRAEQNIYISNYMIACRRNNSGGFNSRIFVKNLGGILDSHLNRGLSASDIKKIDFKLMLYYYPFYLLQFAFYKEINVSENYDKKGHKPNATYKDFYSRHHKSLAFYVLIYPFFKFPRPIAILWGSFLTLLGRSLNGDFIRGIKFAFNKITNFC
jgi:abequosyltransferase